MQIIPDPDSDSATYLKSPVVQLGSGGPGIPRITTRVPLVVNLIRWLAHSSELQVQVWEDKTSKTISKQTNFKGTVHQKNFYRSSLIFWIVMRSGIADLGQRGL